MKKLIPLFVLALCLTGCAGKNQVENPDTLTAAVISSGDSVTAKNTYNMLKESTVATLRADKVDASRIGNLSGYDVIYVDKSVTEQQDFDAKALQDYVQNGGSVFLDNETYSVFDADFIGAAEFVPVEGCPVEMNYPDGMEKGIRKIQDLIWDFCDLYKDYANYEETLSKQSFGVGIVPSTPGALRTRTA